MKQPNALQAENEQLKAEVASLKVKVDQLSAIVEWYTQQIRVNNIQKYQRTSESGSCYQMALFDEAEVIQQENEEENNTVTVKEHTREKKAQPDCSKMELEVVHHDVENKKAMVELKPTIKEEIIYIRSRTILRRHIIHNYLDSANSTDEHSVMVSGPDYKKLIDKSRASASLVAGIVYQKFILGMPLYRIEADFNRQRIPISRQDMSSWLMICTDRYLQYLYEQMRQDMLKEDILYGDETTVNCLQEKDRDKSYMWVQRTSPSSKRQIAIYSYNHSREYSYASQIYAGFSGYLHADGYAAYNKLADVKIVGCWAHGRRKVYEALESYETDKAFKKCRSSQEKNELLNANPAYARMMELYRLIETLFKSDARIKEHTKDPAIIKEQRLAEQTPLLNQIRTYLDHNSATFLPKTKSGIAVSYLNGIWPHLTTYLQDGRLELTNNLAERTVKPFVMGRKGWLFANTIKGARTSAILYSLAQSALANHLKPDVYLTYVLEQMKYIDNPQDNAQAVRQLLPYDNSFPHHMHD